MKEEIFLVDVNIAAPNEEKAYFKIRELIRENKNIEPVGDYKVLEDDNFFFACKTSFSELVKLIKIIRKIDGVYGTDVIPTETEILSTEFPENKFIIFLILDIVPGKDDDVISQIKSLKMDGIKLGSVGFMYNKYYEDAFVFFFADDLNKVDEYVDKIRKINGVKDTKWKILH